MHIRPPSPAMVISCLALLLALGGTSFAAVSATGNAVNIVDPVTAANKAKVDGTGKLQVAVNGTAGARPVAPATPWFATIFVPPGATVLLEGPRTSPINVTSLSASLSSVAAADDTAQFSLLAEHVPGSATTCANPLYDATLWFTPRLTASAPLVVSFPTPLQLTPPAGTKGCLFAQLAVSNTTVVFNASGFVS
jgi:hypothetical protein